MHRLLTVLVLALGACIINTAPRPAGVLVPAGPPGMVMAPGATQPGAPAAPTADVQMCASGDTCSFSCDGGHCNFACAEGSTCTASCDGGNCSMQCAPGATCNSECDGGQCAGACAEGATCNFECDGGNCHTACGESATCAVECDGGNCT